MKQTIKIKVNYNQSRMPQIIKKGDWIDLITPVDVEMAAPRALTLKQHNKERYREVQVASCVIPLGLSMKLPDGMEAIIAPRSSAFKKWGFMVTNSIGIIDNSYNGEDDEWGLPIVCFKEGTIKKGSRICQFRIQLSQKATLWQKIKWFFSNGIKLEYVDNLDSNNRGGFGSTGD